MKVIENSKVKEKVYIEKLKNGLTIIIIPKKEIQKKYVIISTKYGSIDNKFIAPKGTETTVIPDGVAHFLEHKLFEQKDGTNSLDTLTALGAMANAYTTNDHTAYLFETTDNFYKALDELMDYVQNPYFTDENVEKEKGIISQEILMYEDYPEWVVYMNSIKNMYKNHPIKEDPAGTIETISKIDKETLYKCYNTFYDLSNMIICIAGNFEPKKIKEEIEKRIIYKENDLTNECNVTNKIKRIYPKEPNNIVKKKTETKMEVSIPMFVIGIKDKIESKDKIIEKHIAIEILLNILIGKSSKLYKKLYESEIIKSELYLDYEFTDTYAYIMVTGQSKNPDELLKEFENEIKQYKEKGLDKNNFLRIKNMIYGSYIKEYNNISNIANMFISDYFKGINSFDYLEKFEKVTINFTNKILKEVFVEDKTTISIVRGK